MAISAATNEPKDVLYRLKRGLAGYVSYLAACKMNQAFSEYVLYEPILRILTARGYVVECEYECPGTEREGPGDKKRLDFYAKRRSITLGIEVKWTKTKSPNINKDIEKLRALADSEPHVLPLLLIFGRKSHLEALELDELTFFERGTPRIADLGTTKFGCRVFQLRRRKSRSK